MLPRLLPFKAKFKKPVVSHVVKLFNFSISTMILKSNCLKPHGQHLCKRFLAATLSSKSPCESQNLSNSVLKKIVDKEWSSVYIYGLSKRSREEAMREQVTEHLMESQCKNCSISDISKVAVSACPEK